MNKLYKVLFTISNALMIIILGVCVVWYGFYTSFDLTQNNVMNILEGIIKFILLFILLYFCIRFIFKVLVFKKTYSNKWKTIFAKVFSILMLLFLMNNTIYFIFLNNEFNSLILFIYLIIMLLLSFMIEIVFKNKKYKYSIRELIIPSLSICFTILVMIIFIRNINLYKLFDNSKDIVNIYTSSWHILSFYYYIFFITFPVVLINIYTLFCIKEKKK